MPVRPEPQQDEIERRAVEQLVVLLCRRLRASLAVDPMRLGRLGGQPVEQPLLCEAVVRTLVVRRDGALVPPPQRRPAPVRLLPGRELVRAAGRLAAREYDRRACACGRDQRVRDDRSYLLFGSDSNELDPEQGQASSSASSRERSTAAWIAFRNAARTPAVSSSLIAWIVVPPGEVTCSRSSTG